MKDVKRIFGVHALRSQGARSHAAELSTVNGVNNVNAMNSGWMARAPRSQGARAQDAENLKCR